MVKEQNAVWCGWMCLCMHDWLHQQGEKGLMLVVVLVAAAATGLTWWFGCSVLMLVVLLADQCAS